MEGKGKETMKQAALRVASRMALGLLPLTMGCAGFFVYPGSTGTGTGSGGSTTADYVYVANQTANTLSGYVIGTSTLTAVSGSPFSLGFTPTAVVVNPADTIAFVAGSSGTSGFINAYSIGSGGVLSLLASNNVGAAYEAAMAVSPDGQWLLGVDASGTSAGIATIDEYAINASTGQLILGNGATYSLVTNQGAIEPRAIKFAPNGQVVFVALGTAGDLIYSFNSTTGSGALTFSQSIPLSGASLTSDNSLAVSPNGSYLYIARSNGTAGTVAAYTISGAVVGAISGSPFTAGDQPYSVVVNTTSTDVYVANQLDSTISEYSVGSSGALTALSGSPFANGAQPTTLAIDQSGTYLLALSNAGSSLNMYTFTSSGTLAAATSATTGTGPIAMAVTH
jgi:6-phosphogluconolactonase